MAECIDTCFEAAKTCEGCATECVCLGDEEMARCIELCRYVTDVATLHARFMVRNDEYHGNLMETCTGLCEVCADAVRAV